MAELLDEIIAKNWRDIAGVFPEIACSIEHDVDEGVLVPQDYYEGFLHALEWAKRGSLVELDEHYNVMANYLLYRKSISRTRTIEGELSITDTIHSWSRVIPTLVLKWTPEDIRKITDGVDQNKKRTINFYGGFADCLAVLTKNNKKLNPHSKGLTKEEQDNAMVVGICTGYCAHMMLEKPELN